MVRTSWTFPARAVAGALLATAVQIAPLASQATCRPAGSGTSALIQQLTFWITTGSPQKVQLRNNAYHIPVVPTNTLAAVTDPKVCSKAGATYATALHTTPGAVNVVRGGSGNSLFYAVQDPTVGRQQGSFGAVLILDKTFRKTGGWSY
jgi:hypothetical protein